MLFLHGQNIRLVRQQQLRFCFRKGSFENNVYSVIIECLQVGLCNMEVNIFFKLCEWQ